MNQLTWSLCNGFNWILQNKNRLGKFIFFFLEFKTAVAKCLLQIGMKGCGAVEVKLFLLTKEVQMRKIIFQPDHIQLL